MARQAGCMLETNSGSWVGKNDLTTEDLFGYELLNYPRILVLLRFFGSYFKWDSFENAEISKKYGFEYSDLDGKTGAWNFADIDCNLFLFITF